MEDTSLLVERARTRRAGGTWDALSDRDRILIAVWELEADVNKGGFGQYFFNSAGDLAWYVPRALRRIGASSAAEIVERANAKFGVDGPPRDQDQRQAVMKQISPDGDLWDDLDSEFLAYPDDIGLALSKYVAGGGPTSR